LLAKTIDKNDILVENIIYGISIPRSVNRLIISLDDDGEVIPPEALSNIFCLPDDTNSAVLNSAGNGLGLYISFGIAQLHKG